MIELKLPLCPSVNALYYNRTKQGQRGRGKTARYRGWLIEADGWLMEQHWRQSKKINGPVSVIIRIPKTRGDANNYIKAICDYLVSREITGDDKLHLEVTVRVDPRIDHCVILITHLNPP